MSKTARSKKRVTAETSTEQVEILQARPEPSSEEIALRAYEIYLERGSVAGSDVEDWLQAERELRSEK